MAFPAPWCFMSGMPVAPLPDATSPVPEQERIGERDLGEWRTVIGQRLADLVTRLAERLGVALRWSAANLTLVGTALLGFGVALGLDVAAGEVYEAVSEGDGVAAFDRPILEAAVSARTPESAQAVTAFTDLGGTIGMPVIAVLVAGGLALLWRRWTPVILMLIGGAGSLALTVLGKDLVGRARPPLALAVPPYESSPSFPSGHTLNATVVLGIAAYLLILRWRSRPARVATLLGLGLFVLAMGLSRVYLGHHWLTDVVAGWLLGLGWVVTVVTGHRLAITVRRHQRQESAASAARPASSRATGTRNGLHET